jgi:hypothetical protein
MSACIEWTGAVSSNGYGSRWFCGKHQSTHRVAWIEANGEIPEGMVVCHACDNKLCVNLEHLFLGTQADNVADMMAKGRGSPPPINRMYGERHPQAKLTWSDVEMIHRSDASGASLARQLGVSAETVKRVRRGEAWVFNEMATHYEGEPT